MYTEAELLAIRQKARKRLWIVLIPCAVVLAAAVAVFVYGQRQRSDSLWLLTAGLSILAGGAFLFFNGVYARPVRLYANHIDMMLNGRKRETTGIFKSFADEPCDKEGLDCYAMLLNVGDRDEDEDDRLFYYDAHKPKPSIALGTRVTVVSNDRMVSDVKVA